MATSTDDHRRACVEELLQQPLELVALAGLQTTEPDLVQAIDQGNGTIPISRTSSFDQTPDAYRAAVATDVFGKVVIQISEA